MDSELIFLIFKRVLYISKEINEDFNLMYIFFEIFGKYYEGIGKGIG